MSRPSHSRFAKLLCMAGLMMLAACGDQPETAQDYADRAREAVVRGDIASAIIDYKNAVQKSPNDLDLRIALGEAYLRLEQASNAEKEFLEARKRGMDSETLAPLLGEALLLDGDYRRVLELINPDTSRSARGKSIMLSLHGDAQLGLGDLDSACGLYQKAAQLDPRQVGAQRGLGRCALYKEGASRGREILAATVRAYPTDAATWIALGDLEYNSDRLAEARDAYAQALKTKPWSHSALTGHALSLLGLGQVQTAGKVLQTLTERYPDSLYGKALLALMDLHNGRVKEAYGRLKGIREKNPHHLPTHAIYSLAAYSLGQYEQASGGFLRYLSVHPDNDAIRKLLVQSRMKLGQNIDALETLSPMLRRAELDPQAAVLAAELHLKLRRPDKAARYLGDALSMPGKGSEAQRHTAESLLARKHFEEALVHLKSYHGLSSGSSQTSLHNILSLLRSGQPELALKLIADIEASGGGGDTGRFTVLKSHAMRQQGDAQGARRLLEARLSHQPDDIEVALTLAELDLAEGKPTNARQRVQRVLDSQPNHLRGMMMMATLAHRAGSAKERRAWLDKAVAAHPTSILPILEMAHYHLLEPNPLRALEWVRRAEQLEPADAKVLSALGTVQIAAGELNNALASYRRLATTVAPMSADAHLRHALLQERVEHNRKGARFSLRKAIEYQPDLIVAYRALVGLEVEDRNFDTALALARKLQSQLPGNPAGLELEGDIRAAQGHHADAIQIYSNALERFPAGELAVKLHKTRAGAGQARAAEDELNAWLARHPEDVMARVYRADLAYLAGQPQRAIADLEAIQRRRPDHPLILNNLANLYHAVGDARALEVAERGYRLAPDNTQMADTLGWILVERGDLKRALPILRKAQGEAANAPGISYRLAAALAKSGDKAEARRHLQALLDTPRAFPERVQAEALMRQLNR